ncbi:hypothetical protein Q3G72_021944 [Acer saccharum]|nr:hypothetical protein Q3G72_021944 [Acer saccharum]
MKPEQGLASRLQYLILRNCECLMKLPQVLHSLSFLRGLSIEDCPKLVSIPDSALPSELIFIAINKCNALQSLPKSWMQSSNTSLEELSIEYCDSLTDIAGIMQSPNLKKFTLKFCPGLASFPEDGFPTNLTSLDVGGVNICKAFFEWGLHRLASLKVLATNGGCPDMISFPMLPTSLITLRIDDFWNLERLSPDFQDLSSLKELHLISCPNLKFFPEKGLPSSLQTLSINKCPLLKQSCKKDKGLYWPMIALLPLVFIDVGVRQAVFNIDQEMRDLSVQRYWFEGVLEVKEVRVGSFFGGLVAVECFIFNYITTPTIEHPL